MSKSPRKMKIRFTIDPKDTFVEETKFEGEVFEEVEDKDDAYCLF